MQKFRYLDSLEPFILKKVKEEPEEYLNESSNYSNAFKLLESIQKDPIITVIQTHPESNTEINIYDFFIFSEKFQSEGKKFNLYEEYDVYREFVKKGNTLIQLKKQSEQEEKAQQKSVVHARKGMGKIFQLQAGVLKSNIEEKYLQQRNLIFNKIYKSFQRQETIEVFTCNKMEGFTFHISYLEQPELLSWIISSKYLSVVFQDTEPLIYSEYTQYYCYNELLKIAHLWQKYIQTLKTQKLKQLKEELIGYTLIGQYNQSKQTLEFHSIVPPGFKEHCLPPLESYGFFRDFNLECQKPKFIETFSRFDYLANRLNSVQKNVSKMLYEEGIKEQLIFFVDPKRQEMITVCKVKVIEQQIIKKLMKIFVKIYYNQENCESKMEQFLKKFKSEELTRQKFFFKVLCKKVIYLAQKLGKTDKLDNTDFNQVLSNVLKLFSFPQNKISNEISLAFPKNPFPLKSKQFKVIIPISIPGSGKSYFYQQIQQKIMMLGLNDTICESLELDAIRAEELKKAKNSDNSKDKTEDELFHQISKQSSEMYWKKLKAKLEEGFCDNSSLFILYLDKNHTPSNLDATLCFLHTFFANHSVVNYELIQLVPTIPDKIHRFLNYPFSLNYIIHCLFRVQSRQNHMILNGNGINSLNVVLGILKNFETVDFKKLILHAKEAIIEIPFTDEKTVIESKKLKRLLADAVWNAGKLKSNGGFYQEMIAFVNYFQSYKFQLNESEDIYHSQIINLLTPKIKSKQSKKVKPKEKVNKQQQLEAKQAQQKKQDRVVYVQKKELPNELPKELKKELPKVTEKQEEIKFSELQENKITGQPQQQQKTSNNIPDYQQIKQNQISQFLKLNRQEPYTPSTLPKILSLSVQEDLKQLVLEYIIQNLNFISHKYQDATIQEDINMITKIENQKQWCHCKQFNIEVMDLRGKKEIEEISKKPEFYTFVPDKEVHIRIYGMLYIPKTLILCLPFIDASELLFQPLFPYLALLHTNGIPESQAKQFMHLVFTETSLQYDEQFFQKKQNFAKMYNKKSFSQTIKKEFYIVNCAKPIACVGRTKELF